MNKHGDNWGRSPELYDNDIRLKEMGERLRRIKFTTLAAVARRGRVRTARMSGGCGWWKMNYDMHKYIWRG